MRQDIFLRRLCASGAGKPCLEGRHFVKLESRCNSLVFAHESHWQVSPRMARDRTNVEWKSKLADPGVEYREIERRLREAAAGEISGPTDSQVADPVRFDTILIQTDTYFPARECRLKLREIQNEPPELIWYRRPNQTEIRTCEYRRLAIQDLETVKRGLSAILGVDAVVVKTRRLFRWQNVRIHLDQVEKLGDFIEFEAVLGHTGQVAEGEQQIALLKNWLGLSEVHAIATSYRDLMITAKGGRSPSK